MQAAIIRVPDLFPKSINKFHFQTVTLATFGVLPMVKSANLPMVLLVPF